MAASVLALTGVDLLTDADLRERVRADFDERTEGFSYTSPIPEFIEEPSGLPDEMRKFGTRVELKARVMKITEDHFFGGHVHDHPHEH